MFRSYKIEIKPTKEQIVKINKTIGTCRFIYNLYLDHNKSEYEKTGKFTNANNFSKYLNNEFIKNNPEYSWIKESSSKSIKKSIVNAETAFKRFFNKKSGFPKFKKKNKSNVSMYFVMNNPTDIVVERHRIKIPTLGFVRLKEFGYLPLSKNKNVKIKSGSISQRADKYFVSVLVEVPSELDIKNNTLNSVEGIGVDLGIKDLAIVSNGSVYENINKTNSRIKYLEKKLKREQRSLSRKFESKKSTNKDNKSFSNINKNKLIIQRINYELSNIRHEYNKRVVNDLVRTKPSFIAVEDLNVKGIMKNRCLSKAIQKQNFYQFRLFLEQRCKKLNIELRLVNRFYSSSKLCSGCGSKNDNLKLKDRIYKCINPECHHHHNPIDRDYNASLNIRECKPEYYKVLS